MRSGDMLGGDERTDLENEECKDAEEMEEEKVADNGGRVQSDGESRHIWAARHCDGITLKAVFGKANVVKDTILDGSFLIRRGSLASLSLYIFDREMGT